MWTLLVGRKKDKAQSTQEGMGPRLKGVSEELGYRFQRRTISLPYAFLNLSFPVLPKNKQAPKTSIDADHARVNASETQWTTLQARSP